MTIVEVTAAPFAAGQGGGGERYAVEFVRELSRHESVLASFGVPEPRPVRTATELGCPARFISFPPLLGKTNPIPRTAAWGVIGSYLRTHRGEVEFVHIHNLRTAMSTLWLVLTYLRKKDDGIRILLTDHGARFVPMPRLTAAMADYYVPVSHVSEAQLLALATRPTCVVPSAVSAPFLAEGTRTFSERPIDLLFVGRLVPWKRPDRVLELTRALNQRLARSIRTVVAGAVSDPAFLSELRRRAAELGISEMVEFVEGPSDVALIELYSRAKVYCMASDLVDAHGHRHAYPELASLTVLEAAARGTPALANRIPAALEQVRDGVTGYIVDPFGGPATVDLAARLVTDPTVWSTVSRGAREFVERERTYPATVAVFREFLSRIRAGAA